ncbi:MAG: hypothetical protein Q9165_006957 [Trypethelium subeluteriae]
MAAATQAPNRPPTLDAHTIMTRRRSLSSMLTMSIPRAPSTQSLQNSCSSGAMYSADQTSPQLRLKNSKKGLRSTPQRKRNGTLLHAIPGQNAALLQDPPPMSPLEQRMATSPNAEILNNIRGSTSPLKPSISPTNYRKSPMLSVEAKTSHPSPSRRERDGHGPPDPSLNGTHHRGHVHWQPQSSAAKSHFSPDKPEPDAKNSSNASHGMPRDVDLSSYEPPPTTTKSKKPKIQVMIPKNKRPHPIFRKFSKDSDSKSSGKKTGSPDKHSASSARELLPKSGALVPAKAALQLGIASKTPGAPAGFQLGSLRTSPPRQDPAAKQPPPTAPIGPSPMIGSGEADRSFTVPDMPILPATSRPKVSLSDDRSLYEVPMVPHQHDPMPPSRPSQDTTDGSIESEGAMSDEGRLSDYSKRTSMTSLDSKDIPDGKTKGLRWPGTTAALFTSPPTKSGALSDGRGHRRNVSEPKEMGQSTNTRGARLGEQMQEKANSVPSPEKRRFDGAPSAEKPKRSLDEKRPVLRRNEFSRRLESPARKAYSIPSPEKKDIYDSTGTRQKREREVDPRKEEQSTKKDEKPKKSITKARSLSNLKEKPLPPSPPPSAMAILPDCIKSREKNVFDESLEIEIRRTQSHLSPSKKVIPPPRRSHSQRTPRHPARHANNSSLSSATSRSRSRAGSRTRLDQLDRNFINASPKPDRSPERARARSPTLSQAEHDLETHLTAITESPTYYFDHRFKTPEWEKSREQAQRYSSSDIPPIPLKSPRRMGTMPAPLSRKRSSSAPPASPPKRHSSVREVATKRQEQVSADAAEQIIVKIMASLGSLEDLFTTAIINKGFYRTFKRHELDLMKEVLLNGSPAAWEHREFTPPDPDQAIPDDLPVEEYSPSTYLGCYGQDLQIIGGLKALILERCQSVLRTSTVKALATTNPDESKRIDSAFWRIWTFCIIFGARKGREDDVSGQFDWLRGGTVAHTQTCSHTIIGSEAMDFNSVLFAAPPAFAKGNNPDKGLKAEELYDMLELWTCLGALLQGLHGRTAQARQFGIFDDTETREDDINGAEALLEEWLQYIMSLGLDAILGIASLAPETGPAAFELAKEQGWTKWGPPPTPEKGGVRRTFLKDPVGRIYEERIAAAHTKTTSPKAIHRKMSHDRVQGFIDELRTTKSRPTYARLPPSDERPMSDWQGASSELGFGPPVPPVQDWPSAPPAHPSESSGTVRADRLGSVATTGTNETHASPPTATSPAPLPPTIFGHGGPFGSSHTAASSSAHHVAPTGLGITSPSGAPRINSAIPSSPLLMELPLPPNTFGGDNPSPVPTPGAREVPAVLQLDLGKVVEPVGTAERAVQKIREMGFKEEDAKRALRMTDIGDGLRVDRALELLLRE